MNEAIPQETNSLFNELKDAYSKFNFSEFEKYLDIKEGTLKQISEDKNDWSMVIKTGVIIEATLEKLLEVSISRLPPEFINKLNINGRTGKVQLATHLNLIDQATKNRIKALMQIRNSFAHKLEFINHSLSDYYKKIDNKDEYWKILFKGKDPQRKQQKSLKKDRNTGEFDPKVLNLLYWCAGVLVLKSLSDSIVEIINKNKFNDIELLAAYLSKDYSKEKIRKYREIGKGILDELEKNSNQLINHPNLQVNDSTAPKPSPAA